LDLEWELTSGVNPMSDLWYTMYLESDGEAMFLMNFMKHDDFWMTLLDGG